MYLVPGCIAAASSTSPCAVSTGKHAAAHLPAWRSVLRLAVLL